MQIQWTWLGWEETEREGDKERGGERERAVFSPGCIYEHKKLAPAHLPHLHTQSNSFTVVLVGTLTLSPPPLSLSLSLSPSAVCQQRLKAKQSTEAQRHQLTIGLPPLTFLVFSLFSFLFFSCSAENCATHQKASGRTGISLAFMHRKLAQNLMLTKVTIVVSLASASAPTAASLWGLSSPKLVEPNWSELRRHFWQTDRQSDWYYLGYSIWWWYLATNWT